MPDYATAIQEAVFAALNVAGMTSLAAVWEHVPQGVEPPLVIIGDISLEPIGGKDGGLDRATVGIATVVKATDRSVLSAMQAKVRELLDGKDITATGVLFSPIQQLSADGEVDPEQGLYIGTQLFETYVQPA